MFLSYYAALIFTAFISGDIIVLVYIVEIVSFFINSFNNLQARCVEKSISGQCNL